MGVKIYQFHQVRLLFHMYVSELNIYIFLSLLSKTMHMHIMLAPSFLPFGFFLMTKTDYGKGGELWMNRM